MATESSEERGVSSEEKDGGIWLEREEAKRRQLVGERISLGPCSMQGGDGKSCDKVFATAGETAEGLRC
jgi:hypothetical protein